MVVQGRVCVCGRLCVVSFAVYFVDASVTANGTTKLLVLFC